MIIEANTESTKTNNEEHFLQLLPIKVKSEGSLQANIKPFFNGYIKESNQGLSNVFRGRPLNGKIVDLPNAYAAVLKFSRSNTMNDTADSSEMEHDDHEEKIVCHTHSKTAKITCWNYDLPCDDNTNALDKALSYARLANVMSEDF